MSTTPADSVAVLGLGLIGSIWARHLHEDGVLAAAWNRTPRPDFPNFVATPREAAERADVLIIVVADPPAVETVIDAVLPVLSSRHLIIQSSTIGPSDSARFREKVTKTGARYLEAPFTGSTPAAEKRKTTYYLGGNQETITAAESTLKRIGGLFIPCGSGEQTCTIKLAMNLQFAMQTQAICEALALCRGAGVSDELFFDVMRNNATWSGLAALKEPKLRTGDYSPQFAIRHMLKDLRLLARDTKPLPGLELLVRQLKKSAESGDRDLDYSALYKRIDS